MFKKILFTVATSVFVLSLAACGSSAEEAVLSEDVLTEESESKEQELNIVEEDGVRYITNQIVVLMYDGFNEEETREMLSGYSDDINEELGDMGIFMLTFDYDISNDDINSIIDEIKEENDVMEAYMNYVVSEEVLEELDTEQYEYAE